MDALRAQQVPPQPAPGDTPPPGPDAPSLPVSDPTDPTQEPPPVGDPDVVDPGLVPDAPMVA